MKKEIDTRKMQEKNGHRFLQLIFLFMFSCTRDLITKVEEGKENKACHFLFLSYLGGRFIFTGSKYNQHKKERTQGFRLVVI